MSSHLHAHATPLSQRLIRYVSFVLAGFVFYSIQAPANEQWGPFDYYDPPKGSVAKVERPHFGALTQDRARRGDWCWYWGDLEYTLGKFPNHPRALEATAEFLEEHLKEQQACPQRGKKAAEPKDLAAEIEKGVWREKNADYYYENGINFRPNRAATRILYGKYLYKKGRLKEALQQFKDAEKLQPSSGETQYHLGMIYTDMGNYQNALSHAVKAYKLGEQPPDLRDKLVKAGVWKGTGGN